MEDYKQDIQFRFTKSLFLLIAIIQLIIVGLCIGAGAYPRAIQTSVLTATFIITSPSCGSKPAPPAPPGSAIYLWSAYLYE